MQLSPPIDKMVFIFYNPMSGNRQGRHLRTSMGQYFRLKSEPHVQLQIFDLTDPLESETGLRLLERTYKHFPDVKILLWSAGGDGTFVGLLDHLRSTGINISEDRIGFSCFGFGTGNDLPQALGWEKVIKLSHTKSFHLFGKYIADRLGGTPMSLDIWQVRVELKDNGYVKSRNKKYTNFQRLLSNYMTIGLQGVVGSAFEKRRHRSRTWNIVEYAWQSFRQAVVKPVERLDHIVETIDSEGTSFKLAKKGAGHSVELLIQNLPGMWGRQVKLWDDTRWKDSIMSPVVGPTDRREWTESDIGDGKLEVFAIRSRMDYFLKQIPCTRKLRSIHRMGQFPSLNVMCKDGTFHMMIDGEFYQVCNAKSINIQLVDRVCMYGRKPA